MRTVYLMRHAKSRWDEENLADHDRGLTKRGKRDARYLGRTLAERADPPDLIISSSARRARKTARRVAKRWGYTGELDIEERLYESSLRQTMDVLRALPDGIHSVLLVGHNPTLEELVLVLAGQVLPMATMTTVCLNLAIEQWSDLEIPIQADIRFVIQRQRISHD